VVVTDFITAEGDLVFYLSTKFYEYWSNIAKVVIKLHLGWIFIEHGVYIYIYVHFVDVLNRCQLCTCTFIDE